MFAPDLNVYATTAAPGTLGELVRALLDAGVEMPLIDMLYQGNAGNLTEDVRVGIVVGDSEVDGVATDHLAFRQPDVDWQLWVEKGAQALPRKLLITTRYEVGDPQYQAILHWDLKPKHRRARRSRSCRPPAPPRFRTTPNWSPAEVTNEHPDEMPVTAPAHPRLRTGLLAAACLLGAAGHDRSRGRLRPRRPRRWRWRRRRWRWGMARSSVSGASRERRKQHAFGQPELREAAAA